jgi:hypothetical protein
VFGFSAGWAAGSPGNLGYLGVSCNTEDPSCRLRQMRSPPGSSVWHGWDLPIVPGIRTEAGPTAGPELNQTAAQGLGREGQPVRPGGAWGGLPPHRLLSRTGSRVARSRSGRRSSGILANAGRYRTLAVRRGRAGIGGVWDLRAGERAVSEDQGGVISRGQGPRGWRACGRLAIRGCSRSGRCSRHRPGMDVHARLCPPRAR